LKSNEAKETSMGCRVGKKVASRKGGVPLSAAREFARKLSRSYPKWENKVLVSNRGSATSSSYPTEVQTKNSMGVFDGKKWF